MHELIVAKLRCGRCGAQLPVMGSAVTFRCPTCRAVWIAAERGLEELSLLRAGLADGRCRRPLWLPFWMLETDLPHLAATLCAAADLRETQALIAGGNSALVRTNLPAAAELEHFIGTISRPGGFKIYVPAFDSPVERARLSIGRLMTMRRPAVQLEESDGSGEVVPCGIRGDEALVLCRYVFISLIPESIASCAELTERIEVRPFAPPRLVEFPFAARGASLECLSCAFHISGRHVTCQGVQDRSG